jgi:hypothetical protein
MPQRDKNMERRKLQNEELHSLNSSLNTIRVIKSIRLLRWVQHVPRKGENRSYFQRFISKPTGRPMCRWKDNIKIDVNEIGVNVRNLIDSAQNIDYWRTPVNET